MRPNDTWLVDNLEEYKQPVMSIQFSKESLLEIPKNWWIGVF